MISHFLLVPKKGMPKRLIHTMQITKDISDLKKTISCVGISSRYFTQKFTTAYASDESKMYAIPLSFKFAKLIRFASLSLILNPYPCKVKEKRKSIYPPVVRVLRFIFPYLEKFAPSLAKAIAVRLFLTPVRSPFKREEREIIRTYTLSELRVQGRKVIYYTKGEGPTLILLHGWSGRAMQFRKMAAFLVESGFKVVMIDAPGHGLSEGKRSTIFQFAAAFEAVLNKEMNVKAVIAHSLGAAAVSYSASKGTKIPAFIVLGAPVIAQDILQSFSDTINASSLIHDAIRDAAIDIYNERFDDVSMQETFKKVDTPVLSLHGKLDRDVPLTHQAYLIKINPSIDHVIYDDLGHRSILKEAAVFKDIVGWLNAVD